MDVWTVKKYLNDHGAIYGTHYTIGGLGDGIFGIEKMGRFWYSYEAQKDPRYRKTNYIRYPSEEDACEVLVQKARECAIETGHWKNQL